MSATRWDIHQCPLATNCRARWENLEPVRGDPAIRFCDDCKRSVFLCQTNQDLEHHSARGRCVALEVTNHGVVHVVKKSPNSVACAIDGNGS